MRAIAITLATVLSAACGWSEDPAPNGGGVTVAIPDAPVPANNASASGPGLENLEEVQTHLADGEPPQVAHLLPQPTGVDPIAMAAALRESGLACARLKSARQLQQKGKPIDVFKIDCDSGSYQSTIMNGKVYLKPWTGNLMGE